MDLSISSKRNVNSFQATFFEMLSAWSASFLAAMTHRACRERRRSLLPTMRLRVVAESLFSQFQVYPRQPDHLPIADASGAISDSVNQNATTSTPERHDWAGVVGSTPRGRAIIR